MAQITFQGQTYRLHDGEPVLQGLARCGATIPSNCRAGICQSCTLRALAGQVPAEAQAGLSPAQRDRGEFLACVCIPFEDLEVALPDSVSTRVVARVIEKSPLAERVMRLRLQVQTAYPYRAGQFLNLYGPDGLQRSYSIASVPTVESQLELHIARVPQGRMSGWVYQNLRQNDELTISPALGECYYRAESPDQALLLIGTGTGLAPLYGVLRDALRQGHRGEIYLYHGSSTPQGLYLEETLHQLAAHHANFHYFPCVSQGSASAQYAHGRADALALQTLTNLRGMRVYLCGHPAMVRSAQRAVFLGGASMTDIVADAFLSPS